VTGPGEAGRSQAAGGRAVRASRTVVRPNRRNGGTTLVFKLSRPALLRFTIVRVHPSCERVGSFVVRGRAGVNRVPFRGRVRGRPLPDGTYRLRIRPKGARADVAVVTVVIVNGKRITAAELRKARHASACGAAETTDGTGASGSAVGRGSGQSSSGDKSVLDRAKEPIVDVAEGLSTRVRELPGRLGSVADDPFSDPFVLIIIGLLTLSTATLGTLLLAQVVRASETTDRTAR
jgi:hypothetical protein